MIRKGDPNVLFIVCDTLRADHLGCYGYFRETSPTIDRIASEGVVFDDYFNAGSPTGPGFTCLLTGLYAIAHRFYRFGEVNLRQVDDTVFTLAEIMKCAGYTTAAVDNLINFAPHSKHWVRGYDYYVNPTVQPFGGPGHLLAEEANARLIPLLESLTSEKFFLFVHYWDPHTPYNQPDEYRSMFHHEPGDISKMTVNKAPAGYDYVPGWGRTDQIADVARKWMSRKDFSIDLYDGEIAYLDRAISEVIELLQKHGLLDDTLIIITSDHGEQLGQHDIWGHAALHDAETRIPLVMRLPGLVESGRRAAGFCQQIDLLPTIVDLLGRDAGQLEIDGLSMVPMFASKQIRDHIVVENASGQRALRTDRYHLLENEHLDQNWVKYPPDLELYDVIDDPMETINIADRQPQEARRLRSQLSQWIADRLDGESDPIVYPEWPQLLAAGRTYGEKKRRLREMMGGRGVS